MLDKKEMDAMCEETFAEDDIERNVDLGFDPMDVVKGDADAVEVFKKQRGAAKDEKTNSTTRRPGGGDGGGGTKTA